jgi:hypothetical protein
MRISGALIALCVCDSLSAPSEAVAATVICKKNSNGVLTLRSNRCSRGGTKISNISALTGAAGTEGSLRIYGDGSARALNVTSDVTWISNEALGQYTTCAIASGATLTVPTGTVLRCSGAFTNHGTLVVKNTFAAPQVGSIAASGGIYPAYQPAATAGLGWARVAGGNGGYGDNTAAVAGGATGFGLIARYAANILQPGPIGGGAGGSPVGSFGSAGGGSLTILAKEALTNNGTIRADGDSSSAGLGGGGAGGILILASKVSITHGAAGTLEADGGSGGASVATRGNSGGGGGIIHLLAPAITVMGATSVLGGAAGDSSTAVTSSPRGGGAGGGSMAGAGGAESTVASNNSLSGATAGADGLVLQTIADPTALF